jgi:hypothetical protein
MGSLQACVLRPVPFFADQLPSSIVLKRTCIKQQSQYWNDLSVINPQILMVVFEIHNMFSNHVTIWLYNMEDDKYWRVQSAWPPWMQENLPLKLIIWSTVLTDKLVVIHLPKIPEFYEIHRSFTIFIQANQCSPFWSCLHSCLPIGLFHSSFKTTILCPFTISATYSTC